MTAYAVAVLTRRSAAVLASTIEIGGIPRYAVQIVYTSRTHVEPGLAAQAAAEALQAGQTGAQAREAADDKGQRKGRL